MGPRLRGDDSGESLLHIFEGGKRAVSSNGRPGISMTPNFLILATIGFVQLLAVMSPGPSFLITARTAIARSRADGLKVALGLGAGTIVWSTAALLGLHFLFRQFHWLFIGMKVAGALYLLWIAGQIFWHAADPIEMSEETKNDDRH